MQKHKGSLDDVRKIPVQGIDPITDEGLGFVLLRRYGYPITVIPKPVAALFATIVEPLMTEKRNLIFAQFAFKWLLTDIPLWLYLLVVLDYRAHPWLFLALYVVHFAIWFDQFESYILSLHCTVHHRVMKNGTHNALLKGLYAWLFGPHFGVTPETYQSHHVGMHHPHNNGLKDISTTMPFVRDSTLDFVKYLIGFHYVHPKLVRTLKDLGNEKAMWKFIVGEGAFLVVGLLLFATRPVPAVLLWFLPAFALRTGMCFGNWGQHAFINDADPLSNHNQSAVIVDSEYNTKAFNDGYHIMHHIYPSAHYTDLPKLFVAELPNMAAADSIVFTAKRDDTTSQIVDWPSITFLLLRGRYDILADHFVDCRSIVNKTPRRSKEEIVKLLRSRTWKKYA